MKETTEIAKKTTEIVKVALAFDIVAEAHDKNILLGLQAFRRFMNRKPASKWIVDGYGKKFKTLPIGILQQLLDMVFFCQWSTKNFKYEVIANEIVGSIELHITDPFTGVHRQIIGTASVSIMVDAGAGAMDLSSKKPKALETGFPRLSAMCFKNAGRQIGTLFGRDINRDNTLEAPDVLSSENDLLDKVITDAKPIA